MIIDLPVIEGGMVIGEIDLTTDSVHINKDALVTYSCKMSGDCCTRFNIPVTDFDIKRIEDHGYALDQIVESLSPFVRSPKTEFGSYEKNYHIKRKPYTNSCTFLEDGICSIHEFKPFGCRIFPFQYKFDGEDRISIIIHESNYCPSVHPATEEQAQNEEFLQYLLDTLKKELEYREWYFSQYGDEI